jgi:hypothetical protein
MILPEQYMLLYDAIINGDFQPCSERFHNPEVLKSIVIEANTIIVKKLKPGESEKFIQDTDYTCYGYKSCNDFKVMIRDSTDGYKEIILYPLKTYEHSERIDIPHVNSLKCNCFFMLLADEYERIKIRAEKFMHKNRKRKELEIYAVNKIQKAKMLFDEARHRLCSASNGYDAEDALIIFTLCLYLIHIILFIQRHFAHFLQNNSFTEETLKSKLLKCYGFREVTSLIYIIWSSNGAVQKSLFTAHGEFTMRLLHKDITGKTMTTTQKSLLLLHKDLREVTKMIIILNQLVNMGNTIIKKSLALNHRGFIIMHLVNQILFKEQTAEQMIFSMIHQQ